MRRLLQSLDSRPLHAQISQSVDCSLSEITAFARLFDPSPLEGCAPKELQLGMRRLLQALHSQPLHATSRLCCMCSVNSHCLLQTCLSRSGSYVLMAARPNSRQLSGPAFMATPCSDSRICGHCVHLLLNKTGLLPLNCPPVWDLAHGLMAT